MDFLAQIVARKRAEVERRKRAAARSAAPAVRRLPRDFDAALRGGSPAIIAEFKRRSPSKGALAAERDPAATAREYAQAGAAALSILTEQEFFAGTDADLTSARAATALPVLRKDFTIDIFQVRESAELGADAVLLIVAILEPALLRELLQASRDEGLAALVEVHDDAELDRALAAGATLIGINNRDLRTFDVSLQTSLRLRPRIPAQCTTVAESGIRTRDDVRRLSDAGFHALLVGETLLTAGDAGQVLRTLRGREP